jgi:hypothetical protein
MCGKVELLENHSDVGAEKVELSLIAQPRDRVERHIVLRPLPSEEDDRPGLRRGYEVDAAQERALARPRRTDHNEHFAPGDLESDVFEDMRVAQGAALIELVDALEPQDRPAVGCRRRQAEDAVLHSPLGF